MSYRIYQHVVNPKQLISVAVALCFWGAGGVVDAQEVNSEINIYCVQADDVVFESAATDIAAFDADQYGVELTQVVLLPEAGINIYDFDSGQVVCEINSSVDTSTVAQGMQE